MFDKLFEKIRRVDEVENELLSIFEGKSWEYIAKALYGILDDIDTADDICKENSEAFRNMVMKLQAKKNQLLYKRVSENVEDWMIKRELIKTLPNEEAMYRETWHSGKVVEPVQLSWSLDGDPKKLEFDNPKGEYGHGGEIVNEKWLAGDVAYLETERGKEPKKVEIIKIDGVDATVRLPDGTTILIPVGNLIDELEYLWSLEESVRLKKVILSKKGQEDWELYLGKGGRLYMFDRGPHAAGKVVMFNSIADAKAAGWRVADIIEEKVSEAKVWKVFYKDYTYDPPREIEMMKRFQAETEQEACQLGEELLDKEAPGGEWEVGRAELVNESKGFEVGDIIYLGGWSNSPRARILDVDKDKKVIVAKRLDNGEVVEVPVLSIKDSINEDLVDHARQELEIAGLFDKDSDYEGMLGEAVMELIQKFADQGHSGFSAELTRQVFDKLASWKPLSELTDSLDEWEKVSDAEFTRGKPLYQSKRSPSCFSEDGGKTYWDIDEEYYFRTDENGDIWSGGLTEEEWANRPMHSSKQIGKEKK